jgi:hypothetical protein
MASIKQASKASNLTSEHPRMTTTCSLFHSSRCPPQQQFFASGKKEEEAGTSAAALVPPSLPTENADAPHTILASRDVGGSSGSHPAPPTAMHQQQAFRADCNNINNIGK